MKKLKLFLAVIASSVIVHGSFAQHHHSGDEQNPNLHINPRWRECSFQLDPGLTQAEWREFTKEAGMVIYFRPLTDAKPMGAGHFEISVLQWNTGIDEGKDAWNDTFVHPDSTHWLVGGPSLPIPGLTARVGVTDKLDVGVYWTKSIGANYGFYGAQAQYNLHRNDVRKWSTSVRGSFVSIYGPEDVNFTAYGADVITSKDLVLHKKWMTLSPYIIVSTNLTTSHEKSALVDLKNEQRAGLQGAVGVVAKVAKARIAFEYNLANVNTMSMKIGVAF